MTPREHGGPDAAGVPRWDFSTNANACGPAPAALRAVQAADRTRYPDPSHAALREALGAFHGVPARRVLVGASASELIFRLTAAVARCWPAARVFVPGAGFGDYAAAARAHGLEPAAAEAAQLVWHAEPDSPRGQSHPMPPVRPEPVEGPDRPELVEGPEPVEGPDRPELVEGPEPVEGPRVGEPGLRQAQPERGERPERDEVDAAVLVVDRVYAPLRLDGAVPPLPASAWQLWSPNKALGLTGVRGAYALAPEDGDERFIDALTALAPSWPLGADGVALLTAWAHPDTQQWLARGLGTLRDWKQQQLALCRSLGWWCDDSVVPFFTARWPEAPPPSILLPRLRAAGVKLRDAASLGLPGAVRLSVQPPEAQHALAAAWHEALKGSPR